MNANDLKAALRGGAPAFGTCVISTSPKWPEAVQRAGLDFVFIDTEHMPIDRATLAWMCAAYRALNVAPVVRIPSPDPYAACMALDGGACGIVAPYVETAAQVEALRGAVKMRPIKGAKMEGLLRGEDAGAALGDYLCKYNEEHLLIVNIESRAAVEALDDILAVPQVDALLIGPHDLSCSLGVPEQYTHPKFDEAVRTILSRARAARVGAGIHFFWGIEQVAGWFSSGLNFVIHSSDLVLFTQTLARDLRELKAHTPGSSGGTEENRTSERSSCRLRGDIPL
jgi:4-hydroxy-2-oxoheptanedioate aldolase